MWATFPANNVTLEHPEWGRSIVRDAENGKIKSPMDKAKSGFIFIFDCFNCSVALPVNLYVALVILFTTHLRNDPKYVIQLNVVLCNEGLSTLLPSVQIFWVFSEIFWNFRKLNFFSMDSYGTKTLKISWVYENICESTTPRCAICWLLFLIRKRPFTIIGPMTICANCTSSRLAFL